MKTEDLSHLPVSNGLLPLSDILNVLNPSLPLVDALRYLPHGIEGALQGLPVGVLGACVFQQLIELQGVLTDLLDRSK